MLRLVTPGSLLNALFSFTLAVPGSHALILGKRETPGLKRGLLRLTPHSKIGRSNPAHNEQEQRFLIDPIEDLGPDFSPPQVTRPTVNYGGRHPFEEEYVSNGNCYAPLRIAIATHHLTDLSASSSPKTKTRIQTLMNEILPNMATIWSEALSVVPVSGNLFHNQTSCGGATVPETFRTDGVPDADLILYVVGQLSGKGGCKGTTLAYAGPCEYDQHMRPIAGRLVVCVDKIDVANNKEVPQNQVDFHTQVLVHEVGNVLGMSSGMMQYYRNPATGFSWGANFTTNVSCVDGSTQDLPVPSILHPGKTPNGDSYFEVRSPTVVQVVRNQFGCQELSGARLENQPLTPTCFGDHWEERIFFDERSSSVTATAREKVLSPLTLALLHDSSWYMADFTKSSNSPFGLGAGCDFVEGECIDSSGGVPDHAKGAFCNVLISWKSKFVGDASRVEYGCDPSHTQRAVCDMIDYSDSILGLTADPPTDHQHFPNPSYGAFYFTRGDFCPIKILYAVSCKDAENEPNFVGEKYGPTSKCFETDSRNSVCLETSCNADSQRVEVLIGGTTYSCEYEGQLIGLPGYPYKFECPSFASVCPDLVCPSMCSGRGICNYNATKPQCLCDDPNDKSPGCWGELPACPGNTIPGPNKVPPAWPTSEVSGRPSENPSGSPSVAPTEMPSSQPSNSTIHYQSNSSSSVVDSPSAPSFEVNDTTSSIRGSLSCFTEWTLLKTSIEGSSGGTFVICRDTLFKLGANNMNEAIKFPSESNTIVKCGENGTRSDNCTISGSSSHFELSSSTSHASIHGVTMEKSSMTSVLAFGGDGATAKFWDCVWKENYGRFGAAVDVWSRGSVAMNVSFIKCLFSNNDSDFGAVNIEAARASFSECNFTNNTSSDFFSGSAITTRINSRKSGTLSVTQTWFADNNAQGGQGTVFVETGSTSAVVLSGNRGIDNRVGGGWCNDVYQEEGPECAPLLE